MLKKRINAFIRRRARLSRVNIFDHIFTFIERNQVIGDFAEFGTYRGRSAAIAIATSEDFALKSKGHFGPLFQNYHLYDSFEGLPELSQDDKFGDVEDFSKGQYSANIKTLQKRISSLKRGKDVVIYPGFFDKSLLSKKAEKVGDLSVVHVDVDLYSSCLPVLAYLTPRLVDGTIIMFDDYFCYRGHPEHGVRRAFEEWSRKHESDFYVTQYVTYGWSGAAFIINLKDGTL